MKKSKKFLFTILTFMLMITVLSFGSIIVSADFEAYDDNNTSPYRRGTDWFRTIGTSLLVSVIGSAVAVGIVFSRYKFNGRTEPYPYNRKAALELSASEDVLIHTDIKRERIERDRR